MRMQGAEVTEVKLNIYEPPRFFEAFLRGRQFSEAPDITARICGICPVAYQMSSVAAMEQGLGITPSQTVRDLRRLLYCGEWIESHVLHIALLHAPDFLGYEDAIAMAEDHPELVKRALRIKKIGNEIVRVLGGREIHPINVKVGGFYRTPQRRELTAMLDDLRWALDAADELVNNVAGLNFPDYEFEYECVSLRHPDEYPMIGGRIVSTQGLDIGINEYEFHFEERHVEHSNALHSVEKSVGAYLVGPIARFNLNYDRLTARARAAAERMQLTPPVRNPFKSIIVRAVETVLALEEAVRIVSMYEGLEVDSADVPAAACNGFGASEAPRGLLYHRYRLGEDGTIRDAKIVPPTAQNQPSIENDLRRCASKFEAMDAKHLTRLCEQTVRNYDPCISCATHVVTMDRDHQSLLNPP